METVKVTSKGRVTIPLKIRRQLGIRKGSRIAFSLKDDHIQLSIKQPIKLALVSGFGMLKSKRKAVSVDFDAANSLDQSNIFRT